MIDNELEYLQFLKNLLKKYDIDVESYFYLLDYNYEPTGAIYKLSKEINSKNHIVYVKITDDLDALNIFTEYLNLTNPEFTNVRTK